MRREAVLARAARTAAGPPQGIGLSGQMHGLVALDADDRAAAAGDHLERPAHRRGVPRDRGDARARAADRADGQPRAAPASPRRNCSGCGTTSRTCSRASRGSRCPKDYVRLRLCGEHATDVADASGTLLLDVAERRWSEEMLARARPRPGVAAARAREPPGQRRDRRGRAGRRRRRRPGGRRARCRRRSSGARVGGARDLRCRVRRARALSPPTPACACRPSATRCPVRGTRWA